MAETRSATDRWVECGGAVRPADGGLVDCPRRGSVGFGICLACRFLMSSSSERRWSEWCLVEATAPAPERGPDSLRDSEAEVAVVSG